MFASQWFGRNVAAVADSTTTVTYEMVAGARMWKKGGKLHRDGDRPALVGADGTQIWYQHGWRHRDGDRPAVILANGTQEWYQHGKRHRDRGRPAILFADGRREWYVRGRRVEEGGQPPPPLPGRVRIWPANMSTILDQLDRIDSQMLVWCPYSRSELVDADADADGLSVRRQWAPRRH